MAMNIGPKIGIDGEADFRKSLKEMNAALSTLGAEMKLVTSSFSENDSAQKKLKATNEVLEKQLATQTARLAELEKGLAAATEKYGENDIKTQQWKQVVIEAKTALNDTQKQIEKNNTSTEEMTETVGRSHDAWSKLGSVVKAAGVAVAAATAAAAGAAVKLGKEVVAAVAENEQLIGGVETLFKESAGALKVYAEEAYKTAGLSANEYMSTVTSFSASLIQSLDNDTQKATEKANMALMDMSDNANKMGTDMSAIQNAYQGFAKSNYTMLDNLNKNGGARRINEGRCANFL